MLLGVVLEMAMTELEFMNTDYEVLEQTAVDAWNSEEELKDSIKEKYSEKIKELRLIFDDAINKMIVNLFQNGKAKSKSQACKIICSRIQDKCSNFPKSPRMLSNHINEDTTRIFLENKSSSLQNEAPTLVTEESSNGSIVLTELETFENVGYDPRPYDVWNFQLDGRFNIEYPGKIPAGIIFNLLYFFTKPNDLVVDPMAGSGVVGDCCLEVNRRCLMYDINPFRADIQKHDVLKGLPSSYKEAELLFLDPPYYKKLVDEYGKNSIGLMSRKEFLNIFEMIADDAYRKNIKKIALLVSNYDDNYKNNSKDNVSIHDYINAIEKKSDWYWYREIQCPLTTEQIDKKRYDVYLENKKLFGLGRSLVIFNREDMRDKI